MIPVTLTDEPENFDTRCRKRGNAWLVANPKYDRPYDYWSEFEPELRTAFKGLCGYCAMKIFKGQVDHFQPVSVLKETGQDKLAYEWSNFRYGEGLLNQNKWKHSVLDPFDVEDGWFAVIPPSLQLEMTDAVPEAYRELAEFTIKQLGLRDGEVVVRYRKEFFDMYREKKIPIEGLRIVAPLIAIAVEHDLEKDVDWRY